MGDGLNAGAAAVLTDVGGKQVRPSVDGGHPDTVGGVQSGLCNESDLGIVAGHKNNAGAGAKRHPRRVCG